MLVKDRRLLHQAAADVIEQTWEGPADEVAVELAQHYALAGNHEKAIAYFIRSGERAMQISAYPEAVQAYERALELSSSINSGERAKLLVRLGEIHDRRSNSRAAKDAFQAGLELAIQNNQPAVAANALCGLAWLVTREGAYEDAHRFAEEGIRLARQADNTKSKAIALRQLGIVRNFQGDNELAMRDLLSALELFRTLKDEDGIARCLNSLGVVAQDRGALQDAALYYQEALELSRKRGDRYSVGIRLTNLGAIAQQEGDSVNARGYLEEALALAKEIDDREGIAYVNLNLGSILVKEGDTAGAMRHYRAALQETLATGVVALSLYAIAAVAEVQVNEGLYQDGARLLGLAFRHPAGTADIKTDFESVLDTLRARLAPHELEAAMALGEALNLESVCKEILSPNTTRTHDAP
jgi:tetratricopeptide (TPR) repeat protein